jgi:hypothetical protein
MFFIKNVFVAGIISCIVFPVMSAAEQPYDMHAINDYLKGKRQPYSIPGASYVLHSREGESFYAFDGDLIVTIPRPIDPNKKSALLDKAAPYPRPVAFEVRRYIPSQKALATSGGLAHIQRLYLYEIYFYDKNNNELAQVSYYDGPIPATRKSLQKYESIKMLGNKGLDLSGLVEDRTFLWTHPFTWFQRFKLQGVGTK